MRARWLLPVWVWISLACGGLDLSSLEGDEGLVTEPEVMGEPTAALPCPEGIIDSVGWEGEYPGPVVQVLQPVTVPARSSACEREPSLRCTLAPGLYHPWSTDFPGVVDYHTVRAIERFEVLQPIAMPDDVEGAPLLPVGTIVEVLLYLGEGLCSVRVGGVESPSSCPEMIDDIGGKPVFRHLPGDQVGARQLFAFSCLEGGRAWIEVDVPLLAREEIVEGAITGYGEIGPEGSAGAF